MTDDAEKDPKKVAAAEARAAKLSDGERAQIAKKAAAARWAKTKSYSIAHRGSFLQDFGVDVDCFVLDDPMKTAVISQRGMAEAIGFSRRGERLRGFVTTKTMAPYIGRELLDKIENPIIIQKDDAAAGNEISAKTHGYDATILIDLCRAILDANAAGKLKGARYEKMVQQAQIIMGASAKNGIKQLVYALAGYSPSTDEVISAFKLYVQEEAKKYEKEFPPELYVEWHRLYKIPVMEKGRPWHFKQLTVDHIYTPLADSNGKLLTLLRANKAEGGDRRKKLFQFLNEIGARALRMHLGRILEMAESSDTQAEYEQKIRKRFGRQGELELGATSSTASQQPS